MISSTYFRLENAMPKWLTDLFKRTPTFTVSVFMKSGNQFQLHGVKKFKVKTTGNDISGLEWQLPAGIQILDITVGQIECVLSEVE